MFLSTENNRRWNRCDGERRKDIHISDLNHASEMGTSKAINFNRRMKVSQTHAEHFPFSELLCLFFSRHIKSGIPYSRSKDKNNHFPSNVNRSTIFIFSFSSALILATLKLICKTVCVCDIKGDERFFPASQKSLFHRPLTWNGKQRKTENGKAWKGVNDVTANQPSQQNENFP